MKKSELAGKTVSELRALAKVAGLTGYSSLRKADLVERLAAAGSSAARGTKTSVGSAGGKSPRPSERRAARPAAKKRARPEAGTPPRAAGRGGRKPAGSAGAKAAAERSGKSARKPRSRAPARRATGEGSVERMSGRGLSPRTRRAFSIYRTLGEQRVKASKYYLGVQESPEIDAGFTYPSSHGENLVVLMVRDPYWLFAYWEFSPDINDDLAKRVGEETLRRSRLVLRVYDVTGTDADDPVGFHDIDVAPGARDWYINVTHVESDYCVDVGIILPDGSFIVIARSNRVSLPPIGPSDEVDEEWVTIESLDEVYTLAERGPTSGSGGWGSGGWGRG